jgi:transcriptional regulator with XRE-family HTH domain
MAVLTERRVQLGTRLRGLRSAEGLSLEDVAGATRFTVRKLSRIEEGRTATKFRDIQILLDLYGCDLPTRCWCAARILDCVADLRSHLRPGRGGGWLAGCCNSTGSSRIPSRFAHRARPVR